MVLNVHRNHKAYRDGGEGGKGGTEVGEKVDYIPIATLSPLTRTGRREEKGCRGGGEGDYIPIATLYTTRMIPALRWAAMRAILMFY